MSSCSNISHLYLSNDSKIKTVKTRNKNKQANKTNIAGYQELPVLNPFFC